MITLYTLDLILILTGAFLGGVVVGILIGTRKANADIHEAINKKYGIK
jgi:ABC-type uncharacterized transport system permease subunit